MGTMSEGGSMNIFVLDEDPAQAARYLDDVRLPKMCVESAQMMASALRRHGATDEQMPLTKAGKPYKGGYAHHPCTVWVGDSEANFVWMAVHAQELISEYTKRFGKIHACQTPIFEMVDLGFVMSDDWPKGKTPFAQAMPDEYKDDDVVKAYRSYYKSKQYSKGGVRYIRADVPTWWEVTA
jgi:hypothetical protein